MNKIFSLLLLTFILSETSSSQVGHGKYELKGKLSGFPDGTLIYLEIRATSTPGRIDSTVIIKEQFRFSGSLQEPVMRVLLRTKDLSDYRFLWLENASIEFTAAKGKFKEGIITGSKAQDEENELMAAIKEKGNDKEPSILFIKNHPNSIISASILGIYASVWGRDTAEALYNGLSDGVKNTFYGKNILDFISLNKNIKVGDRYIDFTQSNTEGKNISLSDFKGKVVLLEFWGSWCTPCRKGNPELVKIFNEFKDKGFDILGVAADDSKDAWLKAVQTDKLPWQNVSDLNGDKNKACLIYGVSYYPTNYLIDRNGIIIAKDLRGENLRKKLQEIF